MIRSWTIRAVALAGCGLFAVGPALAQAPAQQPDVFGIWKRVCADNAGNYDRTSAAAARLEGWPKFGLPLPLPTGEAKLRRKVIRAHAKEPFGMFFAGDGEVVTKERRLPFQMCAFGVKGADLAATVRQAQELTGQSPVSGTEGARSFRYHQTANGARTPLPAGKLRELAAKLGPGTVVSVDVKPQKATTLISYSTFKL